MKFRFVHAADLHLDAPFAGIGKTSPEIASVLRDASLVALDNLVELAIDREADFLLLAGDIYDGAERSVRAQLRFHSGLGRLSAAGIQTFIVHGNHDPLEGWSAIRGWPKGVTVFGSDAVESAAVTRDGVRLATIHGISYGQRHVKENLARRFKRDSTPGFHVGLLHATVGRQEEHNPYCPCDLDDLCAALMDYWALGHIHQHATLREGAPWVVYPGTLQGRSPKPGELGAKGAVVVEVDGQTVHDVELVPVDCVRFLNIEMDIEGVQDVAELRNSLESRVEDCRGENIGRGLILRGTLTGRGAVVQDLSRSGVLAELVRELREEARNESPIIWWESLRNAAGKLLDRERIRRRRDFSAELIRVTDDLIKSPDDLRSFVTDQLSLLDRRGVTKWLPEMKDGEYESLLREAESHALDLLEEENEA